jgi:dynein light intermediate chain 1, cytosolic
MDLPEGCLKVNLGIPILVVVQKVDVLLHGDKRQFLEQNLDFIQKHIREYSLQFGASVIFTSANTDKNLDVMYQYLLHRQYNFGLKYRPEIIERDNLFLPAGFDSPNLIEQLSKAAKIMSQDMNGKPILYEDVIQMP